MICSIIIEIVLKFTPYFINLKKKELNWTKIKNIKTKLNLKSLTCELVSYKIGFYVKSKIEWRSKIKDLQNIYNL